MKHHNIFTAALAAAALAAPLAASAGVPDINKILADTDNSTPVQLSLRVNGARLILAPAAGSDKILATTPSAVASTDSTRWVVYHNTELNTRYVVSVGARKFLASDGQNAILTDIATPVKMLARDDTRFTIIDATNGGVMGLPAELEGTNMVMCSDSISDTDPYILTIRKVSGGLSADAQAAIDRICSTEAVTAGRTAVMKSFIAESNAAAQEGMENFIGVPQVKELDRAISRGASLDELEALYEEAQATAYPQPGHYYRFHNIERPVKGQKNNLLTLVTGNGFKAVSDLTPATGATGARLENLAIFTVDSDPSTPSLAYVSPAALPGMYLNNWATTRVSEKAKATMMILDRRDESPYHFRLHPSDLGERWLTVSGEANLVTYSYEEEPMWWWIEEVKSVPLTLDANGLATVMLPCSVELPEGAKAYVVPTANATSAYAEEIGGVIPASTPVVIEGEKSAKLTLTVVPGDYSLASPNILQGSLVKADSAPADSYFTASRDDDGNLCFRRKRVRSTAANAAWLPAPADIDAATNIIPLGSPSQSGIEGVESDAAGRADSDTDAYYDLQGRRISRPDRGVYINATTGTVRMK